MEEGDGIQPEGPGDELLAIRCQLGEPAAFDGLVERWHPPLLRYLERMTSGDEAADLAQEVWLRVLRAMPRLREPARLRSWLFAIARRTLMDHLRLRYAAPAGEAMDLEALAEPAAPDNQTEELAAMHGELAAMPAIEREVLVLFYLRELSLDQLSCVLDVPVGTVKSRLHRARRMLRRQLTDKGIQP